MARKTALADYHVVAIIGFPPNGSLPRSNELIIILHVTMYPRVGEKRRIDDINLEDEEAIGSLCRLSGRAVSPKTAMENEKRIRREIANSNERRRMQSINAGFASLKTLLPHHEGEKLSKAAILQQTAEYIYALEQDKARLLAYNCRLRRMLQKHNIPDPEGSPTGGNSPNEDRTLNSSPPPSKVTSTTLGTPTSTTTGNSGSDSDDLRKDVMERPHVERERRTRIKLEDHIRSFESEIYTGKIKDIGQSEQIKFDYRTVDSSKGVKIEISNEGERVCLSPQLTTTVVAEPTTKINNGDHTDYSDIREIRLQKTSAIAPRIAIPIDSSGNAISSAEFRNAAHSQVAHPTTILTVLPSNKASAKSLPPVLELRGISEVHDADASSPTTVEYMEDTSVSSLGNHTVYIVNSSSSSCQKSLDTICEAIRHLEGDHMFPLEEQTVSDIKEEVVTDETYTVDEDQVHHTVPQDLHGHHRESIVTSASYDSPVVHGGSSPTTTIHSTHPLGGSMGHLTLHMIPPEPQEVPLELTTTHRTNSEPHQYVSHDVVCSSSQHVISHSAALLHHATRPGVIVVKHQ